MVFTWMAVKHAFEEVGLCNIKKQTNKKMKKRVACCVRGRNWRDAWREREEPTSRDFNFPVHKQVIEGFIILWVLLSTIVTYV